MATTFSWKASGFDFEKCLPVIRFITFPFEFLRPSLAFFCQRRVVSVKRKSSSLSPLLLLKNLSVNLLNHDSFWEILKFSANSYSGNHFSVQLLTSKNLFIV